MLSIYIYIFKARDLRGQGLVYAATTADRNSDRGGGWRGQRLPTTTTSTLLITYCHCRSVSPPPPPPPPPTITARSAITSQLQIPDPKPLQLCRSHQAFQLAAPSSIHRAAEWHQAPRPSKGKNLPRLVDEEWFFKTHIIIESEGGHVVSSLEAILFRISPVHSGYSYWDYEYRPWVSVDVLAPLNAKLVQ